MRFLITFLAFLTIGFSSEEILTTHEYNLKKLGYWSMHQEIKNDVLIYFKENKNIQGNQAVAYINSLSDQIDNLLRISCLDRLQEQNERLVKLSSWIIAIQSHACGFNGFGGTATKEEFKLMEKALFLGILACPNINKLSFKIFHESCYPKYLSNEHRQYFFKGLQSTIEIVAGVWKNYIENWPVAYYKYSVLPERFKNSFDNLKNAKDRLAKYRQNLEKVKKQLHHYKEQGANENDIRINLTNNTSITLQEYFKLVKEEEKNNEFFIKYATDLLNFETKFYEQFDYDWLDAIIEPYAEIVKKIFGKRLPAISLGIFGQSEVLMEAYNPKDVIDDESYYDQESDLEDDELSTSDSDYSGEDPSISLLSTWKANGFYKNFHGYLKQAYLQELKANRKYLLSWHHSHFYEKLGGIRIVQDLIPFLPAIIEQHKIDQLKHFDSKLDLKGCQLNSNIFCSNHKEVIISSTTLTSSYSQSVSQSNWFGSSSAGSTTYQEFKIPSQINCKKLILGRDTKLIISDSTQLSPDIKIYGGQYIVREDPPARTWTDSWSNHSQIIPAPIVTALGIGAGILTQGLLSGLPGIVLSTAASTVTQSTLSGHDPIKAISSQSFFESVAINTVSAGIAEGLGSSLNINMASGAKSFIEHLQSNALRTGINSAINLALNDQNIKDALSNAVKNIGINSIAGFTANKIGETYSDNQINSLEHKTFHGIVGGLSGFAFTGEQQGLISGTVGAIAAEVAFESMVSKEDIEKRTIEIAKQNNLSEKEIVKQVVASFKQQRNIAKAIGCLGGASLGENADIAFKTADTEIENNFAHIIALRALPVAIWAIQNPDKIIKAAENVISIYHLAKKINGEKERKTNTSKAESQFWKNLKPGKNGDKKDDDGNTYRWDHLHNDIEKYDKRGTHKGSIDPKTGKMYKLSKNYKI